jgi:hypothetical protein
LLALLPIPVIWKLHLSRRSKTLLVFVLSLGLFASVAGIMKAHVSKTILFDPERFVHDTFSMWNFIELDVGIIAASLPALKPLFKRSLEVARSIVQSQPTKTSRYSFREPASLGYARQNDALEKDLEMIHYKDGCETTVKITSPLPDKDDAHPWSIGAGA